MRANVNSAAESTSGGADAPAVAKQLGQHPQHRLRRHHRQLRRPGERVEPHRAGIGRIQHHHITHPLLGQARYEVRRQIALGVKQEQAPALSRISQRQRQQHRRLTHPRRPQQMRVVDGVSNWQAYEPGLSWHRTRPNDALGRPRRRLRRRGNLARVPTTQQRQGQLTNRPTRHHHNLHRAKLQPRPPGPPHRIELGGVLRASPQPHPRPPHPHDHLPHHRDGGGS